MNDGSGNQYIYAMTVGLDGALYASNNSRIFSLTPDGQIISSFYTTSGNIRNIAVSDDGSTIYVIQGNRIVSYNMSGVQINSWGTTSSSASDGLFNSPQGLNIYNNEIYVADLGNNRVQVFDLNGNFLRKWSSTSARSVKTDSYGNIVVGRVNGNVGINAISVYTTTGVFLSSFGEIYNSSDSENDGSLFYGAIDLAVNSLGKIYVIDQKPKVQKFNSSYSYESSISTANDPDVGGLYQPYSIARDKDNNIYVLDRDYGSPDYDSNFVKIKKYNSAGDYIDEVSLKIQYNDDYNFYVDFYRGFKVDDSGAIYFAGVHQLHQDDVNESYAIVKYDSEGGDPEFMAQIYGDGDSVQISPYTMAIDPSYGYIYVAGQIYDNETNTSYHAVRYDLDGNNRQLIGQIEGVDSGNAESIVVSSDGDLYLSGYYDYSGPGGERITLSIWKIDLDTMEMTDILPSSYNDGTKTFNYNINSIGFDRSGIIYLGGNIYKYDNETGESEEYSIIAYDIETGTYKVVSYPGDNEEDVSYINKNGLSIDNYGNVYVLDMDSGVVKVYLVEITIPSEPRNLSANMEGVDGKAIRISWDPPENDGNTPITGYVIKVRADGGEWVEIEFVSGSINEYTLDSFNGADLIPGVEYEFAVYAHNKVGDSAIPGQAKYKIPFTPDNDEDDIDAPNTGTL